MSQDQLKSALEAMLTYFGMDEDEWSRPVFERARAALVASQPDAHQPGETAGAVYAALPTRDRRNADGTVHQVTPMTFTRDEAEMFADATCALRAAAPHAAAASGAPVAAAPMSAPSDAEILALNHGEVHFSESPSRFPEAGHGTQYHAGAPGVLSFARAVLARWGSASPTTVQAAPAGEVISCNLDYATVKWHNQTSDHGSGDPKNSRSWPLTGTLVYLAASGGEAQAERARFESALPKFWSRETFVDDEGDVVYAEEWVQGAWAGWTMALAAKSQKGAA